MFLLLFELFEFGLIDAVDGIPLLLSFRLEVPQGAAKDGASGGLHGTCWHTAHGPEHEGFCPSGFDPDRGFGAYQGGDVGEETNEQDVGIAGKSRCAFDDQFTPEGAKDAEGINCDPLCLPKALEGFALKFSVKFIELWSGLNAGLLGSVVAAGGLPRVKPAAVIGEAIEEAGIWFWVVLGSAGEDSGEFCFGEWRRAAGIEEVERVFGRALDREAKSGGADDAALLLYGEEIACKCIGGGIAPTFGDTREEGLKLFFREEFVKWE